MITKAVTFLIFFILTNAQLNFMVIGDWGGQSLPPYYTLPQVEVANGMAQIAEQFNSQFVVSVGDNFYDNGVKDVNDIRWTSTYENIYHHPSLQTPWYIVAGNRDYYGNVLAEIEYSQKSPRWKFPSLNHDIIVPIPNTNATVHIIFVDSWDCTTSSKENGGPNLDPEKGRQAVEFMANKLKFSTSLWRVVVFHYPIYSVGAHGPIDLDLRTNIEPVIRKYKPDIVLHGHDHNEQHVVVNGINYYVIGGGSEIVNTFIPESLLPSGAVKFKYPSKKNAYGGFGHITIDDQALTVNIYSGAPALKYTHKHLPQERAPLLDQDPVVIQPLKFEAGGGSGILNALDPFPAPPNTKLILGLLPAQFGGLIAGFIACILCVVGIVLAVQRANGSLGNKSINENNYGPIQRDTNAYELA